jgi:hypothetical protein
LFRHADALPQLPHIDVSPRPLCSGEMDLRGTPYRDAAKRFSKQVFGKEIVVE